MKKRLTKKLEDGTYWFNLDNDIFADCNKDNKQILIDGLAAYEVAEEQGQIVVLPCKPGELAYTIVDSCGAYCCRGCSAYGNCKEQGWHIQTHVTNELFWATHNRHDLGETVFLVQEEALSPLLKVFCDKGNLGKTVFLVREKAESVLSALKALCDKENL